MKNKQKFASTRSFFALLFTLMSAPLFFACDSEQTNTTQNVAETQVTSTEVNLDWDFLFEKDIVISEDKAALEVYYKEKELEMSEYYEKRILPPAFDYNVDLSKLSYTELRMLRHTIYARNGYLTMDFDIRTYMEKFKWYQPVFGVETFKLMLTKQEFDFTKKIFELEKQKYKEKIKKIGEYDLLNADMAQNFSSFPEISTELKDALRNKNFAIIPAKQEQLYYTYDQNYYNYIPNFVTTDLVQQLLQKHLGKMLQKIEQEKLCLTMGELTKGLYDKTQTLKQSTNPKIKSAAHWANVYAAIAYSLSIDKKANVNGNLQSVFEAEWQKVSSEEGEDSKFLEDPLLQYSSFKPRGSYTLNDTLKRYFKTVKWLNSANIFTKKDDNLLATIILAKSIESDPKLAKIYQTFTKTIGLFAGDEDNLSLLHILKLTQGKKIEDLANDAALKQLRLDLAKINPDKIKTVSADARTKDFVAEQKILFTAGRYTFDADIFTKMVHVLRPTPKRPFPKGLDVFAAMGNKTAEDILLNHYKEAENWSGYKDSLENAKKNFMAFNNWNASIYNKNMENVLALQQPASKEMPLYMQTKWWDKRNLSTALSAWAQLKHTMLLYIEQPNGAQMGQGGGPPPPNHQGYVEPNLNFWKKSLELIDLQEKLLFDLGILSDKSDTPTTNEKEYSPFGGKVGFSDKTKDVNNDLRTMLKFLLAMSEKELKNETISLQEHSSIASIGGDAERLLQKIVLTYSGSNILPADERTIALTADVYRYNGKYLQASVGFGDEIYVLAEINGLPYITKGSVFSYYEFESDAPLTDQEWQKMVETGKSPARPTWLNDIFVKK